MCAGFRFLTVGVVAMGLVALIRQTGEAAEAGDGQRVQELSEELQTFTDQTNRSAADLGFKDCSED